MVLDDESCVLYSTYLGHTGSTSVTSIAAGGAGELYVTGETSSADFPITTEFHSQSGGFLAFLDLAASPPLPRIRAVVNAASFIGGPLARGELISIFGEEIGPDTPVAATVSGGLYPTKLGGVEVLVDGSPVPLLYVSRTQVNAAIPMLAANATVEVVIRNACGVTPPFRLQQYVAAIGVFTQDGSGSGPAAALNQDNTLNSPDNPAKRGTVVQFWVTGAGLTNPPQPDGRVAPIDDRSTIGLPGVRLGGLVEVLAVYAGAAPGLIAGVAQINVPIPENAPTGPAVLVSIRNGLDQNVTIAIAE